MSCRATKQLQKDTVYSKKILATCGKCYSITQGDCYSCIIREGQCSIEANQYSKRERNTADRKGVYVSEFIHGGVYDEICG